MTTSMKARAEQMRTELEALAVMNRKEMFMQRYDAFLSEVTNVEPLQDAVATIAVLSQDRIVSNMARKLGNYPAGSPSFAAFHTKYARYIFDELEKGKTTFTNFTN